MVHLLGKLHSEENTQGRQIDQAREHNIKDLEVLVREYNAHIHSLETEIQELSK
jgi:hypothetical protein